MFKRIVLASIFVGAFAIGSLGISSEAKAWRGHHHHGCAPSYGYGAPYAYAPRAYVAHPRSVHYRRAVTPAAYHYGAYYGAPTHRHHHHGPAFRLSIGF